MLTLKLIQNLIKVFNSEGTPRQIGFGFALGAFLGLIPFNFVFALLFFFFLLLFNVAFSAGLAGLAIYKLLSFGLDPISEQLGHFFLISLKPLTPFWTMLYNIPGVALTNFNNTLTLGSLILAILLMGPNVWALSSFTRAYRKHIRDRIAKLKIVQIIKATRVSQFTLKIWNMFKMGMFK